MLFEYSRKKSNDKKVKKKLKVLPTYLSYFLEHVMPVLYPDAFPYCWISISNKYVKQLVLINHSWISPILQQGWDWSCVYSSKNGGGNIFLQKKGEVVKIIEEWRLLKENNLCLLADLCVYKSKKHFYYMPKFLRQGFK